MNDVCSVLSQLVRTPSVTGEEGTVAELIGDLCLQAGLATETVPVTDRRWNVVARWPGGKRPCLMLMGHMDVVPPGDGWTRDPFGAQIDGGRLYGRGACDMKAGLASMLCAISSLKTAGVEPPGDVVFAAVVGEEEDQAGSRQLVANGIAADAAVIGEPTGLDIVRAHRGVVSYRLVARGMAAHAGRPELGHNAIQAMTDVVAALRRKDQELALIPHPILGRGTVTVGTISGGTRPYVVPDRCQIEVDRRILPGENTETVRKEADDAAGFARGQWPWLQVEFEPTAELLPFETPEDHPLVQLMKDAAEATGLDVRVAAWDAVSDASILANGAHIPTLLFGPGDLRATAHRPNEWVDLSSVRKAVQVYEEMMLRGLLLAK